MQVKNIYAVYDSVSQTIISALILEASDAPAIRAFYDALRNQGSALAQHPADYDLMLLGSLDMDTGTVYQESTKTIATGNGWLEMQKGLSS